MASTPRERGQSLFYTIGPYSDSSMVPVGSPGRAVGPEGVGGVARSLAPPPARRFGCRPHPLAPAAQWGSERGGYPASPPQSLGETGGMFPAVEEAERTVFVGNLEARVREEILYELFLQVQSLGKGRPRGRALRGGSAACGAGRTWPFRARPPSRPDVGPWF